MLNRIRSTRLSARMIAGTLLAIAVVVGITDWVFIVRFREAAEQAMTDRAAAFTAVADQAKNHTASLHQKGTFSTAELLK